MGFLSRLFERRSTLRNPADWLTTAFGGGMTTTAGVDVGPDKALTLSSYFAAIRAISEDVAKLPLILYRNVKGGGKERVTGHPLYRLLHDAPNSDMASMSFRETLTMHAIGWGGGYAEIVRNASGRPTAIWPIDPNRVRIERDTQGLRYVVSPAAGQSEVVLQAADVLHVHGLGFDGLTGYSVATLARESIGAALGAEQSGAALFGNSSRPDGVLKTDRDLGAKETQELARAWKAAHQGVGNAHKTALLKGGLSWQSIAVPNKDAQWIEARQFMVSELARWLRIPPHKIGDLSRATFTNIESQSREYLGDTLLPWLTRWEQEIQRKLIGQTDSLFAEHLVEGLLRAETAARYEAYGSAIRDGWMSRNEARIRENLNPMPGLDEFLVQPGVQPATPTPKIIS